MTTIAMAAGMLPSAMLGAGGEFRAPMAIAVIGGLIVSTLLSLILVLAFFILMDDFSRLLPRTIGLFVGPSDEPGFDEDALVTGRLGDEVRASPQEPMKIAAATIQPLLSGCWPGATSASMVQSRPLPASGRGNLPELGHRLHAPVAASGASETVAPT